MNLRVLRLPAAIAALLAVALAPHPSFAGDGEEILCKRCFWDCPDEPDQEAVCDAVCPPTAGEFEDAVCDEDAECPVQHPGPPNLIVCKYNQGAGGGNN